LLREQEAGKPRTGVGLSSPGMGEGISSQAVFVISRRKESHGVSASELPRTLPCPAPLQIGPNIEGCLRRISARIRVRFRAEIPPQIPKISLWAIAQPRQSRRTGHSEQTRTALTPSSGSYENHSSGSNWRHSAKRRHGISVVANARATKEGSSVNRSTRLTTPSIRQCRRGLGRSPLESPNGD
jgi:hypothetical protein